MTLMRDRIAWDRRHIENDPLDEAVVFDVSDVTKYFYEVNDQDEWDLRVDFPCLIPPFPALWLESRRPDYVLVGGAPQPGEGLPRCWAVFIQALSPSSRLEKLHDPEQRRNLIANHEALLASLPMEAILQADHLAKSIGHRLQSGDWYELFRGVPTDVQTAFQALQVVRSVRAIEADPSVFDRLPGVKQWGLQVEFFVEGRKGNVQAFDPLMVVALDQDGIALRHEWRRLLASDDAEEDDMREWLFSLALPLWFSICFMHCKNVETVQHQPNAKLSRAHRRRHGRELVTYHTLAIEPMKRVLRTEGDIEHTGIKKALHICRGHFAHYGEKYGKGKLFGKHEGQFWVPSHVRGSVDVGIADKDYAVKAPAVS